jgi:hypothetical protein
MAADTWLRSLLDSFGGPTGKDLIKSLERVAERVERGETFEEIYLPAPPLGLTWADLDVELRVQDGRVTRVKSPEKRRKPAASRKRERPHWAGARERAFQWMEYNGPPQPNSGEQAELEEHVKTHLRKRKVTVAESTIRAHVANFIWEYQRKTI